MPGKLLHRVSERRPSGAKALALSAFFGMAEQVAEKFPKYGHSEEAKTTKKLHLADLYDKQVLRFAQNDHAK